MTTRKKKPVKTSAKSSAKPSARALVPQPHGGALLPGAGGGPQPGSGRPPDAIRGKLREIGLRKAVPFLDGLLDGEITVSILGKCEQCDHEQAFSQEWLELIMEKLKASVDQRIKASEQTLKYGLQAKELVIASDSAAAFFDCVTLAIVELHGEQAADAIKARAAQLMEAKA